MCEGGRGVLGVRGGGVLCVGRGGVLCVRLVEECWVLGEVGCCVGGGGVLFVGGGGVLCVGGGGVLCLCWSLQVEMDVHSMQPKLRRDLATWVSATACSNVSYCSRDFICTRVCSTLARWSRCWTGGGSTRESVRLKSINFFMLYLL